MPSDGELVAHTAVAAAMLVLLVLGACGVSDRSLLILSIAVGFACGMARLLLVTDPPSLFAPLAYPVLLFSFSQLGGLGRWIVLLCFGRGKDAKGPPPAPPTDRT